jgi:hypothetical protein
MFPADTRAIPVVPAFSLFASMASAVTAALAKGPAKGPAEAVY